MLKLVSSEDQVRLVRDELRNLFLDGKAAALPRRLTFPGPDGPLDGTIYWRADLGLWGYFSPAPVGTGKETPRWLCWFGVDPGAEGAALTPNVEINLPVVPGYRAVFGRSLIDDEGRLFLAHKGGLGGGQGGQVKLKDFHARIRGFAPEPVLHADEREELVLVIGAIGSSTFLDRLHDFVEECRRLREDARKRHKRAADDSADENLDSTDDDEGGFTPENGTAGTGERRTGQFEINRLHGHVVNALEKALKTLGCKGINKRKGALRPDLYLCDPSGKMKTLFEVKVSSDTQSWFTALGQLLVYGARDKPRRILVAPAPLQNSDFEIAMRQHNVALVTFREQAGKRITFFGLEEAAK